MGWGGLVAHEILVSAQGPFLGFWVWGFGVWGLGLTIFSYILILCNVTFEKNEILEYKIQSYCDLIFAKFDSLIKYA